jgi:hypothetical protein
VKVVGNISQGKGLVHWDVVTSGDDVLTAASTDAVGVQLNLSHICGGGGGDDPTGRIGGIKFYDVNTSGSKDGTETNIAGFRVTVQILDENDLPVGAPIEFSTDATGAWGPLTLDVGTKYRVCELLPTGTWDQTGPLDNTSSSDTLATSQNGCWTGTVGSGTYTSDLNFGNVCLGNGGGLTLGFWSNRNGATLFNANGGLGLVNALSLANATGAQNDFANHSEFRSWLLSASATNMAYMLSAQMAAMKLNVSIGGADGDVMLLAGTAPAGCVIDELNANGYISASNLIGDADSEIAADSYTPAGDAERACQEFKKIALDEGNNNKNWVQPTACAVIY